MDSQSATKTQARLGITGSVGNHPSRRLSSNNPYRRFQLAQVNSQGHSHDIEEPAGNAPIVLESTIQPKVDEGPMVVEREQLSKPKSPPVREADKEVVNSWQKQSGEECAPIPMQHHESNASSSRILEDEINIAKGQPPSYDNINDSRNNPFTSPRPIEPDVSASSSSRGHCPSFSALEPDGAASPLPHRAQDTTAIGQLLSWIPSSPRPSHSRKQSRFVKPVVIPQSDVPPVGEHVPFLRCYSDILAEHDVPITEFVAFLDGLSIAQAPSSALQGIKAFGVVATRVPLPFIPIAGHHISALATSGSGHRARLYLTRANKEYFVPRGLHLDVVRDEDIAQRLHIPQGTSPLAPLSQDTLTNSICERRLARISPYIAPLRFDVPSADKDAGAMERMLRRNLDDKMRKDSKQLAKLRRKQWQTQEFGTGKGIDALMEEEQRSRRLNWLVIETWEDR